MFEEELSFQFKKERVDQDRNRNSHLDNELTKSNKVELQKWALKLNSKKKEKIPSESSKVVVHKTKETPLAKTQLNNIDNVTEPKFPPSKDCKWRNPTWKMKGVHRIPTQEKDSVNPSVSNKPNEQFLHEAEDANYIKITQFSHPKLVIHILGKANSISSDYNFSHSCNARIQGSILHNFQYKNFVVYTDTGASINLIARPHLKHIKYTSLLPQKLRITGINKTSTLKEHERVIITLC